MEKKNISRTMKVGAAAAIALMVAGVSVYAAGSGGISEAEAKQIALAEVQGADSSHITHFRKDKDDGRTEYDIEIIYGGYEYDFEISAKDGTIFDRSKEQADEQEDALKAEADQQSVTSQSVADSQGNGTAGQSGGAPSAVVTPNPSGGADIGLSKAKRIAVGQVSGASSGSIVSAYADYDDGRLEYNVEIHYNGYEYEFEIDGASGQILSKDVDRIDGRSDGSGDTDYDDDWDDGWDD